MKFLQVSARSNTRVEKVFDQLVKLMDRYNQGCYTCLEREKETPQLKKRYEGVKQEEGKECC